MTCLGLISDLGYFVFVNMFMNIGKQPKSDISPQGVFGGLVLSGQNKCRCVSFGHFFCFTALGFGVVVHADFYGDFFGAAWGWRGQRTISLREFCLQNWE